MDVFLYKETGILRWMCRVIKKREYYGGCVYKETGILPCVEL